MNQQNGVEQFTNLKISKERKGGKTQKGKKPGQREKEWAH
jgi:hypothetical protein